MRDTALAIGLAYAVMAQVDALGALSAKLGLGGVSSSLFFLWFAALPVPVGALLVPLAAFVASRREIRGDSPQESGQIT